MAQNKAISDKDVTLSMPERAPKKKILEKDIQKEICDWLMSEKVFFWRHNNAPIFQRDKYGGRFRRQSKYTPNGLPDIMIMYKGFFIGLEVKVPNYWKRTDAQVDIMERMQLAGARYYLVTSLQEAKDAMKHYFDLPI